MTELSRTNPIHIVHFVSCAASGGAEVYVKDLSIASVKRGHSVTVIFLDRAEESGRSKSYEREFLRQLDDAKVQYEFVGARARRNPVYGWRRVQQLLRKIKADIVHAHLFYALFYTVGCGLPVVYTRHGMNLRMPGLLYRLIFNRMVSAYVGISVSCARALENAGCRPVVKINNGVDASRLSVKKLVATADQGDCDEAAFTFVAVGRLVKEKNYPRMLLALARLPRNRSWRLLIAGEGGERKVLEALITELELGDRVELMGAVSNVKDVLAVSDAFVMSSDSEGLPISLIEATLTGLPVVVTNVGGCAEVVHAACNGIVVDSLSAEGFATALTRMMDDEVLRSSFSRNALLYGAQYELSTALDQHLRLYAEVLGSLSSPE